MMTATIMIVEDDIHLANLIKDYLDSHGYEASVVAQGDRAIYHIQKEQPDMVILDLMLPKIDGLTICRQIRQSYNGLILMLTAKPESETEVAGLELGADAYLHKPIDEKVLLAHIEALLRRKAQNIKPLALQIGRLKIDAASRSVWWHGELMVLSQKEFELLYFLVTNAGQVLSRDVICQALKGFDYDGYNRNIDMLILSLRKKFGDNGRIAKKIKTVWGKGYLLNQAAWE